LLKLVAKISPARETLWRGLLPIIGCSLFAVLGLAFYPLLGIENDEALFANAFYEPRGGGYAYRLGHSHLPLMILSYLGTLKSWIYRPIYGVFGTSVSVTRVPAVLAGAATVWVFYRLLYRIAGRRAALVGCGLLVTDAVYLLSATFDWGPVVLQHVLVLTGLLSLLRFWQDGKLWSLALGSFLFGLALWDKALAVWTLSGIGLAALVMLPRQLAARASSRRLGVATLSLCLGALPLILYNIHTRGGTFHGNTRFDPGDLPFKIRVLADTFRGSGLLGYFSQEDWQTPHPHPPGSWLGQASATLASKTRHPHQSLQLYGFLFSLLLIPLARGPDLRALVFALIVFLAAWAQMALNAGTGSGLHHTILLWPLPQAIMAISFTAASRRLGRAGVPVVAAATTLLMGSGLLLINEYYSRLERNGGTVTWTDAIFPLTDYLKGAPAKTVFSLDWGFLDSFRMLSHNQVPVRVGEQYLFNPELTEEDRSRLRVMIADPSDLFVAHPEGREFYPGLAKKLVQFAASAGYRQETLAVIADSYDRPMFEVFRFAKN
jgi:4-amino-4-deoxy-L-arabinose transferase-like glycosyltransferase